MSPKEVKKLTEKKYRTESGLFLVEGRKNIEELLTSDFVVTDILGTADFLDSIIDTVNTYDERVGTRVELKETKQDELERIGTFVTNDAGIAVVKQKESVSPEKVLSRAKENIVLALDDIRDPGNLGTIIRIADWFGVTHIVASETTVDFYNPKTVTATMGSFTRVSVLYTDLPDFLTQAEKAGTPIVVADMAGESAHTATLPKNGILLMGSESHGVSEETRTLASQTVSIPRFGSAESLNVSVATGILLDAMRR